MLTRDPPLSPLGKGGVRGVAGKHVSALAATCLPPPTVGEGMQDFTGALHQLVDKELISTQTAYQAAPNPDELRMRLKGISVTGGGIIG